MKKIVKILIIFSFMISVLLLTSCNKEEVGTLDVFNWGDFMDKEVIKSFEKEFGVKVTYSEYASNEDLYVKLKQGGINYDVVFPSDYMIERMIKEEMLEEINMENIPNKKMIDPIFFGLDYDPNDKYSLPYMFGTVGIIYNPDIIDGEITSWADLWNEKYSKEILMYNSQRDSLMVALKKLGYSMNTRNINELEEAKEELLKQKKLVYAFLGDDMKDVLIGEEAGIGVTYSGDAVFIREENPKLKYVVPKEGTNIWFDSIVIPKGAKNKELAEKFINYILSAEMSAINSQYLGYSTVVLDARKLLDEERQKDEVAYPDLSKYEKLEIFRDPGEYIRIYDRIWTEVLSGK